MTAATVGEAGAAPVAAPAAPAPFDPSRHLRTIKVRGGLQAQYLPAAARILWLRHDHPTARIVTAIVVATESMARFRCEIELPNGALAVAHGQETAQGFPDFFEKAETVAISRALGFLGYGTDGAHDIEDRPPAAGRAASAEDRVRAVADLPAGAATWFRRELARCGIPVPRRFERWGDVVGVLVGAGHAGAADAVDETGIDYGALKALVEALPDGPQAAAPTGRGGE